MDSPAVRAEDIPISFSLTVEEFRSLFADAEPPTDDDVPFRFSTRVPLKRAKGSSTSD